MTELTKLEDTLAMKVGRLSALLDVALEYGEILSNPEAHEWYEVEAAKRSIARIRNEINLEKVA